MHYKKNKMEKADTAEPHSYGSSQVFMSLGVPEHGVPEHGVPCGLDNLASSCNVLLHPHATGVSALCYTGLLKDT